jgi:hypothetical protein
VLLEAVLEVVLGVFKDWLRKWRTTRDWKAFFGRIKAPGLDWIPVEVRSSIFLVSNGRGLGLDLDRRLRTERSWDDKRFGRSGRSLD